MVNISTLSELRLRARRAANMEKTLFVSDEELNEWLNVGLSELHDIMITSFNEYFEKSVLINVITQQSSYELPEDFYKLIAMDQQIGSQLFTVRRFMPGERNFLRRPIEVLRFGFDQLLYRIIGRKVQFVPNNRAGKVFLRYAPEYRQLRLDTDRVEEVIPQGWEDLAVYSAAIRALEKEESDTTAMAGQKLALMTRIEQNAESRDANAPWRIADVGIRTPFIGDFF